jgi:hypothetical protein
VDQIPRQQRRIEKTNDDDDDENDQNHLHDHHDADPAYCYYDYAANNKKRESARSDNGSKKDTHLSSYKLVVVVVQDHSIKPVIRLAPSNVATRRGTTTITTAATAHDDSCPESER